MANNKLIIGGLVLAGLLLLAGGASAASPAEKPEPPADDPDEPAPQPQPQPQPQPEPQPPDLGNWGATPDQFRVPFEVAETASGIPGLSRFLAIRAWSAFRAGQPIVSPEQAKAIAASNPDLCLKCHNTTASERAASCRGIERVTMPKGVEGPCGGVGSMDAPWPKAQYEAQWKDFGSAGLFDILSSSALYAGIHEGKFTPLLNQKPEALFDLRVQLYVLTWMIHRHLAGPREVIVAGNPRETWLRVQQLLANPAEFDKNSQYTQDVRERFAKRAAELGIDMDAMESPSIADLAAWPGPQAFSDALAVI